MKPVSQMNIGELAAYICSHLENQCLEQAVLVSYNKQINYKEIERWSRKEGKLDEYKKIKRKLSHINTNIH
ncbi:MAG: hypothetical protein FWD47_14580 [Treponema sp.]|nr:hypothetical protein [Treponema sp.]